MRIKKYCNETCNEIKNITTVMDSMRSIEKNKVNPWVCCKQYLIDAVKNYPASIATCNYKGTDGHYSDGSYYYSRFYFINPLSNNDTIPNEAFENFHKQKGTYKKTEWQKTRDECMEITIQQTQNERLVSFYNDCLKERGY